MFNANDYTTRQLLEMEFQNVPNGEQKENLIAEALQLVEECAYTVGEAANEVRMSAKEKMPKLMFTTVSEGLEKIKEEYLNGEVMEGEFGDYLVLHFDEYFDASIDPTIAMRAIQEFRQWDYQMEGDDAIETFGGVEEFSDNGYYGFIFMRNGQSMQLPDGVRIGIKQEDGGIALDEGISPAFSKSQEKQAKRIVCDCCDSAYFDFVLTDENMSANPMYICTMCSDEMEKRNHAIDNGDEGVCKPSFSNQEIEKFHADFAEFKKANEEIDSGNL